ncbi:MULTISPECIES: winged helix-turn-helix transcriptional regulator [unclassified Streptomyces]|uniref:winged helix-turn-helix transcriptional regulator n=1 Tax=unclassified Streptomyces TaxID=2593676 RepID=UPI0036382D54
MALTGPAHDADLARVTEALGMITPRWNVRVLLALSGPPQRYGSLVAKMPWMHSGQLHPKLQTLCDAGLVERTEHTKHHVTYGHTDRGAALLPVLPLIVTWAETYLEKPDRPLPAIEQIEDSLVLLGRRRTPAILWALRSRGETSGQALAQTVAPGNSNNTYAPLRQLVQDGLVETAGKGHPYRLTAAGDGLGPVFAALSAWAAGRPLTETAGHPVWGHRPDAPAQSPQVSSRPRQAPTTRPATVAVGTAWRNSDLFSHGPKATLPTGGPRR